MKHLWKILVFATFLAAHPAGAEEAPSVTVKGGNHACVSGVDGDVCAHFFGETDVTLSVAGGAKGCSNVKAVLVQVSKVLEAPLEDAVEPAAFDDCKGQDITVHLPKVDNETEFHVTLTGGDDKAAEVIIVPLKAFPRTLLDPLKSWAKFEGNALVVKDKDGKLAGFLDRNKVDYSSTAAVPAKSRKLTIVVADPEDMKEDKPEGDVMYLTEKVKEIPLVTVERTAQSSTATANVNLIDGLAADDPLTEKAFIKIFTMISK
jgi:hypothetical protein